MPKTTKAVLPVAIRNLLAMHAIEVIYDKSKPASWALYESRPARVSTFLFHLFIERPESWDSGVRRAIELAEFKRAYRSSKL